MENRKVAFLDIDGVVNRWLREDDNILVEKHLAETLVDFINRTGAEIVLTSTHRTKWEKGNTFDDYLRSCGIIVSGKTSDYTEDRYKAVEDYIIENSIKYYTIIDDEYHNFRGTALGENFVKVEGFYTGLTEEDCRKAEEILKRSAAAIPFPQIELKIKYFARIKIGKKIICPTRNTPENKTPNAAVNIKVNTVKFKTVK